MDLTGILSLSGKSGLFKSVAQTKNGLIVESLIDKKRFPAYVSDKVSSLEDICIFTAEEDLPLKDVFELIYKKRRRKKHASTSSPNQEWIDRGIVDRQKTFSGLCVG